MAWDSDKSTATDPDNPASDEQLTADEWDAHVAEGHWPGDELNLGVESGDPVLTDPQNGGQVVLRYDRATGDWVVDSLRTDDALTKRVATDYHYASEYDGADPDARLGNAISAAESGNVIYLEDGTYSTDRTLSKRLSFVGTSADAADNGTVIDASWTFDISDISLTNCRVLSGNSFTLNIDGIKLDNLNFQGSVAVTVSSSRNILTRFDQGDVTFESGTTSNIIDSSVRATATDNDGSNTVGDIA